MSSLDKSYFDVRTPQQLVELCNKLKTADRIGFDTEFVSEDTFRPELCLVQVAIEGLLAVIDPQEVGDMTPFWNALADGDHITIAHAAREEINFSLTAVGKVPANLFDTQLAAAFCSNEYPAAYGSVVTRFLGVKVAKGEQRTDWRRRPLSDAQIDYALEDVRHLFKLHDKMMAATRKRGRDQWMLEETVDFVTEVTEARERERWRKVSGIGNLPIRSMAILRELWRWRQAEAERRNMPPKRVFRDDLMVELAKRKTTSVEKMRAVRGMQFGNLKKVLPDLAECVQRGLEMPLDEFHSKGRRDLPPQINLLGQFITPAISSICREENIAASMVGTASEVRELIAYRLGCGTVDGEVPSLAKGWRAGLVGNQIDDLLGGRRSIRIDDPNSDHPLVIDNVKA